MTWKHIFWPAGTLLSEKQHLLAPLTLTLEHIEYTNLILWGKEIGWLTLWGL